MTKAILLYTWILTGTFTMGLSPSPAEAAPYLNPAPVLNLRHVDPTGKVELLKTNASTTWNMKPALCYEFKVTHPSFNAKAGQWMIVEERGATATLEDDGLTICAHEKLASFSLAQKENPVLKEHFLLEVTSEPVLSLGPECDFSNVKAKLSGEFIGVGLECKTSGNSLYLRAHFGASKNLPLQLLFKTKLFPENKSLATQISTEPKLEMDVVDAKRKSYGHISLTLTPPAIDLPSPSPSPSPVIAVTTPTPIPSPKPVVIDPYGVPGEVLLGLTLQTRSASFFDGSPDNQNLSDKLIQLRVFRRALLPFPFKPKLLKDLHYTLQARTDFGSTQNIDANLGILKPIPIFTKVRTLIGVSEEFTTTLKSNFGVTQFIAPSLDVQIEKVGGSLGTRLRFAYSNSSSIKYDAQVFYLPPWRKTSGLMFSVDYGYLTFPSSSNVQYTFKETRIGFQLGYRFGPLR